MGSKVSKPEASSTSSNTGPTPLAAVAPSAAPVSASPVSANPATLENTGEPLQRGARIRVLKDTRSRKRNRNHRSHRRQRNRHGSRSRK